jgi:hypothetical protein
MSEKGERRAENEHMTLRVEGSVAVTRLQELLRREPELKLEIMASRKGSPPPLPPEVR